MDSYVPINDFTTSFASDHRQQRLTKVAVCGWMPNDMVTEDHQTQVVHIVNAILLYVHTVLHSNKHYQSDMMLQGGYTSQTTTWRTVS